MVANFRHGSSKPTTVAGFADWMSRMERWVRHLDNRIASKAGGGGGEKGDPGVGIQDIVEEPDGYLTVDLTDGTQEGPFEMPVGPQGEQGEVGPPGASGAPVGAILMWATSVPPTGWLICDGAAFDADTYPTLAQVLGGNSVPDMRDRMPFGASSSRAPGAAGGSLKITTANLPSHVHEMDHTHAMGHDHGDTGGQSQNHTHGLSTRNLKTTSTGGTAWRVADVGGVNNADGTYKQANTGTASQGHTHAVKWFSGSTNVASRSNTSSTGSGTNYLPPYRALTFIIRATADNP